MLGTLIVFNLSFLSMNSLNQTKTAVFTLLLQVLHPEDRLPEIIFVEDALLRRWS